MKIDRIGFNWYVHNGVEHMTTYEVGQVYQRTTKGELTESKCLSIHAFYDREFSSSTVANVTFDNNTILEIGNINQIIRSDV